MRYIYRDRSSDYRAVTDRIGYNLADRRLQDMLIVIFKALNNRLTVYIKNMFRVRTNINRSVWLAREAKPRSGAALERSTHDYETPY